MALQSLKGCVVSESWPQVFVLSICSHWGACALGFFVSLEQAPENMQTAAAARMPAGEFSEWGFYCATIFWATQTVRAGDLFVFASIARMIRRRAS